MKREGNQEKLVLEKEFRGGQNSMPWTLLKSHTLVRWEQTKKKCVIWILQMEIIVDLARAKGVGEMKTEDR